MWTVRCVSSASNRPTMARLVAIVRPHLSSARKRHTGGTCAIAARCCFSWPGNHLRSRGSTPSCAGDRRGLRARLDARGRCKPCDRGRRHRRSPGRGAADGRQRLGHDGFRAGQGAGGRRLGLFDRGHGRGREGDSGFAFAPHVVTVAGGVPIFSADGKTRLGAAGAVGRGAGGRCGLREAGIAAAGLRSTRS